MRIERALKNKLRLKKSQPRQLSEAELCVHRAARNREAILASKNRSILFFTTHKCASTFTSKFLRQLDACSDLRHVDYSRIVYREVDHSDAGKEGGGKFINDCSDILFSAHGDVYGPLRNSVDIRDVETYRKIFFLRDPRDVLVSAYYSFGFSHGLPPNAAHLEAFLCQRARIQEEGIDRYCKRSVQDWIMPLLQQYQRIRETSGGLFLSYRDFVDRPEKFATRLLDYVDLTSGPELEQLMNFLVNERKVAPKSPSAGDPTAELSHQRSGRHDQYLHELEADTVEFLNHTLAEQLKYWDFDAAPAP